MLGFYQPNIDMYVYNQEKHIMETWGILKIPSKKNRLVGCLLISHGFIQQAGMMRISDFHGPGQHDTHMSLANSSYGYGWTTNIHQLGKPMCLKLVLLRQSSWRHLKLSIWTSQPLNSSRPVFRPGYTVSSSLCDVVHPLCCEYLDPPST